MFMDESMSLSLLYEISSKILALWYSLVTVLQQILGVQWCLPLLFGMENCWSIQGLRCLEDSSMFITGVANHTLGQPSAPSVWNPLTVPQATTSSHSSVAGPLCKIYHLPYPYLMKVRHTITRSSQIYCQLPRLPWISLTCFLQSLCLSLPKLFSHCIKS